MIIGLYKGPTYLGGVGNIDQGIRLDNIDC